MSSQLHTRLYQAAWPLLAGAGTLYRRTVNPATLRHLLRPFRTVVNEWPVPPGSPTVDRVRPLADVQIRPGTPADSASLARFASQQKPVAWSFGRGDQVVVAELAGKLIGCCWVTALPFRSAGINLLVRPAPDEWFCYGLEVDRAARRHGIGKAILDGVLARAQAQGIRLVFGHAYWRNPVTGLGTDGLGQFQSEELHGLILFDRYPLVLRRRCLATSLRRPPSAG